MVMWKNTSLTIPIFAIQIRTVPALPHGNLCKGFGMHKEDNSKVPSL